MSNLNLRKLILNYTAVVHCITYEQKISKLKLEDNNSFETNMKREPSTKLRLWCADARPFDIHK